MSITAPSSLIEALRWRYATKVFDPSRTIANDLWQDLEKSLVLTPSSFGLQPWKFIVITDRAKREALVPHAWNQRQIADCSHLVVFAVPTKVSDSDMNRFILATAEARGTDPAGLEGYKQMMAGFFGRMDEAATKEWATRQTYIALGQFMLACSLVGVDTCPMEGFLPDKFDDALGLKDLGITTSVLCPAGYRDESDKYASYPKVRYPQSEMVLHL